MGLAAHVIGYVGEVSEAELNTAEFARFHQGDVIGKDGIERQYNDILMGVDGQRRVEVDSFGNERQLPGEDKDKEAIPGKNLQLTIDLDLQAVAELDDGKPQGRGGGARSAQRRSAGHGEPSGLRSQSVCRPHPVERLEGI